MRQACERHTSAHTLTCTPHIVAHTTHTAGANLTCTAIYHTLKAYYDKYGHFPPKLHVQVDNTCKDNKNNTVMAFMALLVQQAIFTEVEMHFLLVGHTHIDLDGTFGT